MNYFCWLDPTSVDPSWDHWEIDFPTWAQSHWSMVQGQPVDDWDAELVGWYSADFHRNDFYTAPDGWHIYSQRLRALTDREVPRQVQCLSFRLCSTLFSGEEFHGYCIANHLVRIDAIDFQRSVFNTDPVALEPEFDLDVKTLVLSRPMVGDHRLFRIVGQSDKVIVREDLKHTIEAAGITGCRFGKIDIAES